MYFLQPHKNYSENQRTRVSGTRNLKTEINCVSNNSQNSKHRVEQLLLLSTISLEFGIGARGQKN